MLVKKIKTMRIQLLSFASLTTITALTACASSLPEAPAVPTTPADTFRQLAVGQVPHGMAATTRFVYNSNIGDNTLSVIDTARDEVIKTLKMDAEPGYSQTSHDGQYVLVVDGEGYLNIFAPAQDHQRVQRVRVGRSVDEFAIAPDDKTIYVSLTAEARVAQLNFENGLAAPPEPRLLRAAGPGTPDGSGHRALAYSSGWLLTPNPGDNTSSLIPPQGDSLTLSDGNAPTAVAFGIQHVNKENLKEEHVMRAIVGHSASHTVTLFDTTGNKTASFNDVGQTPTDMVTVPELGRAYVTMTGSNQVTVIDYVNDKVVGTIKTQQRPVHIYRAPALTSSTDNAKNEPATEIWVGNDGGASVTVFDASTLEIIAHHKTGEGHHKMAFSQNKVYVSNIKDHTVTVIPR